MLKPLRPLLFLLLSLTIFISGKSWGGEFNTTEPSSEAENAFREIVTLWRAERYEDLYEQGRRESQQLISRQDFVRLMRESNVRLQCCWTTVQNIKSITKTPDDVYVSVTLGYDHFRNVGSNSGTVSTDHWESSSAFKDEIFLLNQKDGRWTIDLVDILSAGGYIFKGSRLIPAYPAEMEP